MDVENGTIDCHASYASRDETLGGLPFEYSMIALCGFICISGLLSNLLVVCVMVRHTVMWTVNNLFILNLSISDSIFLCGLPIVILTALMKK